MNSLVIEIHSASVQGFVHKHIECLHSMMDVHNTYMALSLQVW